MSSQEKQLFVVHVQGISMPLMHCLSNYVLLLLLNTKMSYDSRAETYVNMRM